MDPTRKAPVNRIHRLLPRLPTLALLDLEETLWAPLDWGVQSRVQANPTGCKVSGRPCKRYGGRGLQKLAANLGSCERGGLLEVSVALVIGARRPGAIGAIGQSGRSGQHLGSDKGLPRGHAHLEERRCHQKSTCVRGPSIYAAASPVATLRWLCKAKVTHAQAPPSLARRSPRDAHCPGTTRPMRRDRPVSSRSAQNHPPVGLS